MKTSKEIKKEIEKDQEKALEELKVNQRRETLKDILPEFSVNIKK